MDKQDIIARLREYEPALRARGVTHAALVGSRARGDARPDSDTDIMIDIDPDAPVGVYEYVGVKDFIASLFDGPVDVVDREGLKRYVRPAASGEFFHSSKKNRTISSLTQIPCILLIRNE
jgi:predicted nucleotidyltransferase